MLDPSEPAYFFAGLIMMWAPAVPALISNGPPTSRRCGFAFDHGRVERRRNAFGRARSHPTDHLGQACADLGAQLLEEVFKAG